MINCRTRGLILTVHDYGESDKIVTFFSPDIGRAGGIAKGAKRSKKRFVNKLEEFSLLQIMYRPARREGLLFISEAELDNAFLGIRYRYSSYLAAVFIIELVLRLTREHDPDPQIFALLAWAMQALDERCDPLAIAALFHLKILDAAGYQPQLEGCCRCSQPVRPGPGYTLNPGSGLLLCSSCSADQRNPAGSLSVQTLRFMQHAQRTELQNLSRLRLPGKNGREILDNLQRYTRYLLQHDIISWNQLRRHSAENP